MATGEEGVGLLPFGVRNDLMLGMTMTTLLNIQESRVNDGPSRMMINYYSKFQLRARDAIDDDGRYRRNRSC